MLKKSVLAFLLAFFVFLSFATETARAIYDPTSVPNNRFGIHLGSAADLADAANLLNTSGGDWGYVTFVIQKNQRDTRFWQTVFDQARRLHLVPIVRVATQGVGDGSTWEVPSVDEIDGWVSFFDSLNWVIKNRYVIIGNEPNHAKEWGGKVDPKVYGQYLLTFSTKLKNANADYFVLPAGLDASAPNSKDTMDEANFLNALLQAEPKAFDKIDGWDSHAYPNPAFSGSENDTGRGSIRTFDWELALLSSLGFKKSLPVFITETGWLHTTDKEPAKGLPADSLGAKYASAFEKAWNDPRVVAVSPFILSYPDGVFAGFSWKKPDGTFYKFYGDVAALKKEAGRPIQETSGEIMAIFIPPVLGSNQSFWGLALAKNNGQSIWKNGELSLVVDNHNIDVQIPIFGEIEPRRSGVLIFRGVSPKTTGLFTGSLSLAKNSQVFTQAIRFQMVTIEKPDFWLILDQLRKIISLSVPDFGKILT